MFTRRNQPETAPQPREAAGTGTQTGYMAELEQWLDENVFEPIENAVATGDTKELHLAFSQSKQLLKRKVLASYHNGLKAKMPTINRTNYEQNHKNYRRN